MVSLDRGAAERPARRPWRCSGSRSELTEVEARPRATPSRWSGRCASTGSSDVSSTSPPRRSSARSPTSPVRALRDQRPRHLDAARGLPRARASSGSWSPRPTRPTAPTTSFPTARTSRCSRRAVRGVEGGRRPDRAQLLAAYGLPVAVTRFANIYGGGDLNFSRLIPEAVCAALDGRAPVLRSDGSPERDFLYVEDAADAYLAIAGASTATRSAARRSTPAAAAVIGSATSVGADRRARRAPGSSRERPRHGQPARAEIDRQYVDPDEDPRALSGWEPGGRASRRGCGGRSSGTGRSPARRAPGRPPWRRRPDAPGRIRTCDFRLRRAALYPLSYGRREAQSEGGPPGDGAITLRRRWTWTWSSSAPAARCRPRGARPPACWRGSAASGCCSTAARARSARCSARPGSSRSTRSTSPTCTPTTTSGSRGC